MSYKNIVFDCDSTLCSIEGIDELAKLKAAKLSSHLQHSLQSEIVALTNAAMDGKVPLADVYALRLDKIKPSLSDIKELSQLYIESLVEDAAYTVKVLQSCNINVFIVSGGLYLPIIDLAKHLSIPESHVFAVEVNFDEQHLFESLQETPLTTSLGKQDIINKINQRHPGKTILIGDGASDLAAKDMVDLFIGYGGVESRANVKAKAEVFFQQPSLLPLLAFCDKPAVKKQLIEDNYVEKCQHHMRHSIDINDQSLRNAIEVFLN